MSMCFNKIRFMGLTSVRRSVRSHISTSTKKINFHSCEEEKKEEESVAVSCDMAFRIGQIGFQLVSALFQKEEFAAAENQTKHRTKCPDWIPIGV
ncbi:hypothetical protein L6452_15905 [Arctium lappa]|uniref:Uncharacterized protein n=1 Tax=Arctium lappa TaxID=4217 RepID=A0ACB9CQ30_ARCLA|nr:hypothetical protein L6452_15905 [Arctium lappa]